MIDTFFLLFRSSTALVFGMAVSILFTGVHKKKTYELTTIILYIFLFLLQVFSWRMFGLQTTLKLYPFITHLPSILFLALYFKRPWLISISSVLTSYLCCQFPRWIGSTFEAIFNSSVADHIGYFLGMCIIYYIIEKYIADSVVQLMKRSTRSCMLFGAVPLLYYLFDYTTTIYTNWLYSGARAAVQFTPSVICTFYLFFVLQYYNESHKQEIAQREKDLLSSQFKQAQVELDTMRQKQKDTMIYRHDMRHHLALIGGYAAEGDLQKIKDYLAIAEVDIDTLTPVRYCENETVNLILSSFQTRANKTGVVLNIDVKLPPQLNINDTELCALLSNALENAINAASQMDDEKLRKVHIYAVINNNKLVISTENAYMGKIEMDGELPKSKLENSGHGFGIKSMIAIVERHNGLYSIETEGGVFILQLMLPLIVEL